MELGKRTQIGTGRTVRKLAEIQSPKLSKAKGYGQKKKEKEKDIII